MLRQLGIAMLDGGEATNDVEDKLYEIARARTAPTRSASWYCRPC